MAPNTRMSRRSLQVRSVEEGGGKSTAGRGAAPLRCTARRDEGAAPPRRSCIFAGQPLTPASGESAGREVEGWGGCGWSDVGKSPGTRVVRCGERDGRAQNAVASRRGEQCRAAWSRAASGRRLRGIGSVRARRSPGSRSRGFVRGSGVGGSAPRRQRRAGAARGRDRNGQRRGSSPARFSQRSSIFRMKEPPSPVPGAVGPWPPPGPPPEDPVPEEVPLGPVMA